MATQKTPKTSNKLKYGDTRADGFRFGGYENVTLKSGITKKMGRWYSPEVFLKRRERSAESSKRAKLNNPEKYAGHSKNWRLKNPERSQNARLKNKFGISVDEYNKKLARQNSVCAICEKSCGSGRNLAVDHCHASGKIRGLLCSKCNLGLGLFKDDIILLATAKRYLNKHKKPPCKKPKKSPSKSQARSGQ